MGKTFVGDTESTTEGNIYLWGICDEYNKIQIGYTVDSLVMYLFNNAAFMTQRGLTNVCYFHNLKWDSSFIISHLLKKRLERCY